MRIQVGALVAAEPVFLVVTWLSIGDPPRLRQELEDDLSTQQRPLLCSSMLSMLLRW